MQKSSVMFLIAGVLIIGGLALSVWSNQVIFEDFAKKESKIIAGEAMIVVTVIKEMQDGVFAVNVLELEKDTILVTVTDPSGNQIAQETVNQEAFEGYFDVAVSGSYTLRIENSGVTDTLIVGYIGPEPDALKRTIAFISIYVLVIGLVSMVITMIYALSKRKKSQFR